MSNESTIWLYIDPVCCIQLSDLAYAPVNDIPNFVGMGVRPLYQWEVIWGPAVDPSGANLVYVAYYAGPPTYIAVVTRGTDVESGSWSSIFQQIVQDMDVSTKVELPWASSLGNIVASGTYSALQLVQQMTATTPTSSNPVSLQDFLTAYVATLTNNYTIVVTGHSLGGCLSTVIASWLQSLSLTNILPITFAAPTAGDAAFQSYFDGLFPAAIRYHNSLDAIPYCFSGLKNLRNIYDSCSNSNIPPNIMKYIDDLATALAGDPYKQPAGQMTLKGTCASVDEWYEQVEAQHSTKTYTKLVNGLFELAEQPFFSSTKKA